MNIAFSFLNRFVCRLERRVYVKNELFFNNSIALIFCWYLHKKDDILMKKIYLYVGNKEKIGMSRISLCFFGSMFWREGQDCW